MGRAASFGNLIDMLHRTRNRILQTVRIATLGFLLAAVFVGVPKRGISQIPELKGLEGLPGFGAPSAGAPRMQLTARWYFAADPNTGWLEIHGKIPKGWDHLYAISQPKGGPDAARIELDESKWFSLVGPFVPDPAPEIIPSKVFKVPEHEHRGPVTWRAPIRLLQGAEPSQIQIAGAFSGQVCRDQGCSSLDAEDHKFVAKFDPNQQGPAIAAESDDVPVSAPPISPSSSPPNASSTASPSTPEKSPEKSEGSFLTTRPSTLIQGIALGLLGGLILNLMPCVLPVIGLKVMSFVQQSQGDRRQALLLNLVYALGILAVMMILATLSVQFNLSWGEQFTIAGFKITLIVLVFAMALSFLGVWEVPIPGFLGGTTASGLAAKEGVSGAFLKGVFATVLATPCSGPLLGPLFGFTLNKPPYVTYAIFAAVAMGMALPYLWIGAFPRLVRWIPKPGAWMETFKQLMAFPLLATVVYLFMALGDAKLFAPTLSLCFAVWFACWWIGRTPLSSSFGQRAVAWIGGIGVACLVGYGAFNYLVPTHYVPWQPFSPEALAEGRQQGKTVMVDFTAGWCPACILNSSIAIDTPSVAQLVKENQVVALIADWTDKSSPQGKHVKATLNRLGSNSIPFLAIFPANDPDRPILLPDSLLESQVLGALRSAGPSGSTATATIGGPGR